MTYFEKNQNVIIEQKSPSKAVIYNTVTGAKKAFTDKTDIRIILAFDKKSGGAIENLASELKIDLHRIKSLLKKLTKRKFLSNTTEDYTLPD